MVFTQDRIEAVALFKSSGAQTDPQAMHNIDELKFQKEK
jgi:hypothetical protein